MSRTVGEVLSSAYVTLNDDARDRYKEPELLGFVVDALNMVKNVRPDLFLGRFKTSIGTLTDQSELPIDEQFFRPIVDYIISRAESKDAEHVESGRVKLMAEFTTGFLS